MKGKNKGITLIALIIMVSIILILVGTTIYIIVLEIGKKETKGKVVKVQEEKEVPLSEETLETYILGADGKGRVIFEEICDKDAFRNENTLVFLKDSKNTNSTIYEKIRFAYYDEKQKSCYIRYNNKLYKFKYEIIEDENKDYYSQIRTVEDSLEEISILEGNLGKYVEYAGNTWIVLRDDKRGVELITANTTENRVELGDYLDFDIAAKSYNNAVTKLINECKDICREKYSIEIGGNVKGIRCVGGPEIDETESTQIVDFSKLTHFKLQSGLDYGKFTDKKLKVGDDKYLQDYNQMKKIGILVSDNSCEYFLASRFVDDSRVVTYFNVRYVNNNGGLESTRFMRSR